MHIDIESTQIFPQTEFDFELVYFWALRNGVESTGYLHSSSLPSFHIQDNKEHQPGRLKFLTSDPKLWSPPTQFQVKAAVHQFQNMADLCEFLSITRQAVFYWYKEDTELRRQIQFPTWQIILQLLGMAPKLQFSGRLRDVNKELIEPLLEG